jgi:hypothetical protein
MKVIFITLGRMKTLTRILLCLATASLAATPARANERHMTYTYETAVLPAGERELELWTTWRAGRERYYRALDNRLELEIGLTDRLMTAFYLNLRAVTLDTELGSRESRFEHRGVSSEWKYQLLHPELDVVGLGLYAEFGVSTSEYEIEGKLLFDERIGPILVAANLVGEIEWEVGETETEREIVFAPVAGVVWQPAAGFGVGLEVRNHNEFVEGEWEHSALHGGPVVSYARGSAWAAVTFLPQIASLKGGHGPGRLILDEHERLELRLLVGSHL